MNTKEDTKNTVDFKFFKPSYPKIIKEFSNNSVDKSEEKVVSFKVHKTVDSFLKDHHTQYIDIKLPSIESISKHNKK